MRQQAWVVSGVVLLSAFRMGAQTTTVTRVTPSGGTITSTTNAPDYSRRDRIENDIDNGIAIGITLYERHQALTTAHNEAVNAFEGLYQSDYEDLDSLVVLAVPEIAAATSTPSLHGHSLGESWQQFVSRSPKLQAHVTQCAAQPVKPENKKHRTYDQCEDLRYMQINPVGSITMTCRNADFMVKDVMCSDFDGEVVFADGTLVSYKYFAPIHWKGELADLTAKFGPPSGTDKDNASAIWRTHGYSVAAERVDGGVSTVWETAKQFAHTQAKQKELEAADD